MKDKPRWYTLKRCLKVPKIRVATLCMMQREDWRKESEKPRPMTRYEVERVREMAATHGAYRGELFGILGPLLGSRGILDVDAPCLGYQAEGRNREQETGTGRDGT